MTKEKAAEHRAAIIAAASRLFRERGFDNVGIAEIMQAAGLTHGAFYGHFVSKDALAAAACDEAFADSLALIAARLGGPAGSLRGYVNAYLSQPHRDHGAAGCPMAAYVTEIAHQDEVVQKRFAAGIEHYIDALAERLPNGSDLHAGRRHHAIGILAKLVGGMALARATRAEAPELSEELLASLRTQIGGLADGDGS